MFGVCFCVSSGHISRPDEFADQSVSGALRAGVADHGPGDPDATAKERRLGCGIWRRGHGKHFWSTDDQCAGEIHDLAGGHFFRADAWGVDPLCAPKHG